MIMFIHLYWMIHVMLGNSLVCVIQVVLCCAVLCCAVLLCGQYDSIVKVADCL